MESVPIYYIFILLLQILISIFVRARREFCVLIVPHGD